MIDAADRELRLTQAVAGALAAALAVYGLVLWVALRQAIDPAPPEGLGLLRMILAGVAGTQGVLALAASALFARGGAPTPRRFRVQVIVQYALSESIALYGLVLGFLSRQWVDYAAFALPAAALMVWLFPTRARYDAACGRS